MHTSIRPARLLSGLTLLAVVSFGFVPPAAAMEPTSPAPQQAAAETAPETAGSAPERSASEVAEAAAAQEAATSGTDVVVEALTTPSEQVVAAPDGKFTKTVSSEPVRMQYNGQWADISTDLVERDGVLKPKMVPAQLAVGKGGSNHMSSVADGKGHSVTESWPYGSLPAAQVRGNTATYPNVLPGVDLIQVAKKQGISQVLKIYTPEAARDPRVVELKLKLDSTGVALSSDGKGGLKGTSQTSGEEVLRSAAGRWWDSRHEGAGPGDPGGPGVTGSFDLSLTTDAAGTHEKLGIGTVTTRTDLTYPLYIDPDWSTTQHSFLYVDNAFPGTNYLNGQYTDGSVHVGFLPAKWDYAYGVNHATRGYWQFTTQPMAGKHIFAARFNVSNIHSSSCSPRVVTAYVTSGIGPGTTWNNQPNLVKLLESKSFAHGYSGCGASTVAFDMAPAKDWLSSSPEWAVGLIANGEGWDEYSWKRFANNASVTISYGTAPNTPQLTGMTFCSHQCPPGQQNGLTRFDKPVFTVNASDPDGNTDGSLAILAAVRKSDGTSVWEMTQGALYIPGTGGSVNWGASTSDPPLTDGDYYFIFHTQDGTGLTAGGVTYHFKVDTTAPPAPTISAVSTALGSGLSDPNGVVGQTPYEFKLTNPSADPVKGFIYALTGEGASISYPADMSCGQRIKEFTMICPADGKTTTFTTAAITIADTRITAWAVDEAGNVGTFKKTLNGSTAAFTVGNYAPMPTQSLSVTTSGSATSVLIPAGTDGPTGTCTDIAEEGTPPEFAGAALGLQGGYGSTTAAAADTANSFTVSGWFCPTVSTGTTVQPVITQKDSAGTVLAELRINTSGRWELATRTSAGATVAVSATGTTVQTGTWYFVNSVYDKINRQLRITSATSNDTQTWTVATTSEAHASTPAGSTVLLGASTTTAGTPRFTGLLAGPALTNGVLDKDQIVSLWGSANPTTVTVLK
ncbi:LamG-like jellyroll fold domain-containing protein [Arthrobacter rhizosphaerae]|uniref:LamG-like jellyroll fold domain-containing protein n=1 Tax=Arthrobacter rhizosphaerae TaxID=2855490 RepID=UPI001FF52A27|nr:LamG-like jellyroll fold domain-containing protein [Arthrobacter rhizosphaerae]